MEFVPKLGTIWVTKLNLEDPIYEYDNEEDALAKLKELEASDSSGRKYRVVSS